jgi:hypothetical protein
VLLQDLPYCGGGDLDTERGQFAVDTPVAPGGVLLGQPQHQGADGLDSARASWPSGCADCGVPTSQQIAVPPQEGIWADQQYQLP